jgi:hypothetical protein
MAIPEYDNAAKWAVFFRSLPMRQKIILGVIVVLILGIFLYFWLGPMRTLRNENEQLKNNLSEAQKEIITVRDKKDELHRENLHLQELIDPIRKKAELLYPEMETAAAIAKLSEDLQNVRSLATRDVYKPLIKEQRDRLVIALKDFLSAHSTLTLTVSIIVQQGNSPRVKVANDLKNYLEEAGCNVKLNPVMSFYSGIPPDISIEMNPEDLGLAQGFAQIVGTLFINKQFAGIKREKFERGHIEITINGDPLFAESGIVTFR